MKLLKKRKIERNLKNQEIFVKIKNGNLKLPETEILFDDNKITAIGLYELVSNNIDMKVSWPNLIKIPYFHSMYHKSLITS